MKTFYDKLSVGVNCYSTRQTETQCIEQYLQIQTMPGGQTGELDEIRNSDRIAHLSYLETGCILLMNYNLWTTFKSIITRNDIFGSILHLVAAGRRQLFAATPRLIV